MKFDVNFLCRLIVSFSYFNTCTYCIRKCELNSFEKQNVSCLENSFQDHAVLDLKTIKTCKFNMHRDTIFVNFCYAIFAAARDNEKIVLLKISIDRERRKEKKRSCLINLSLSVFLSRIKRKHFSGF